MQEARPIERRIVVADHAGAVTEEGPGETRDTARNIACGAAGE